MHNVSQRPNLRHFGELLGGAEGLPVALRFRKVMESMGRRRVADANGSEFQTMGAATLKPRDAKIVRTHGTDNRLAFAENRERVGYGNSKGSV